MTFSFTSHPSFRILEQCLRDRRGGRLWVAMFAIASPMPLRQFPDYCLSAPLEYRRHQGEAGELVQHITAYSTGDLEARCVEFLRAHDDAVRDTKPYASIAEVADDVRKAQEQLRRSGR